MKECDAKLPRECKPRVTEALERVVQPYVAWGKPDHAAERRAKLPPDSAVPAAKPPD